MELQWSKRSEVLSHIKQTMKKSYVFNSGVKIQKLRENIDNFKLIERVEFSLTNWTIGIINESIKNN